ncbi:isochorismatase family protein [Micrococcus sp.]|uniref:isochorismatase family protein n=1 Tax=Micrococcus sp. TaxID=1271 RepID=UPI002A911C41|nr:isochorismatase family protein [Micrococcus sp.]MDY6055063.1 isochorismatase family protein [Micrococcus sp.]
MSGQKTHPQPVRDQATDHLLTPENCVLTLIDFQKTQYETVTSASRERINLNVEAAARIAAAYDIPVVLSTVGVDLGVNPPTEPELKKALGEDMPEIDRTGVNAWEDAEYRAAIEATGRKKVVIAGLWTEVCMAEPTLDMLAEGYEVYPLEDGVGGISTVSHEAALRRVEAAGARPITAIAFASEIMRDWARPESDRLRELFAWYFPRKAELDKAEGIL